MKIRFRIIRFISKDYWAKSILEDWRSLFKTKKEIN